MTDAQIFDAEFRPALTVEYLTADKLIANVTDGGVTLLVTGYYCAHCRDSNDGAPWCDHKDAAFRDTRFPGEYEAYADQRETYADALDVGVQ